MKVKFHGFQLEPGSGITLPEFGQLLVTASDPDTTHDFNGHKRIFLFEGNADKDFYTGLLITTKDHKSFCELRRDGGKLKIKVSELEKGSQLMDFNFFILHKKSFCGMYQHYHASCSILQFCIFLRETFWRPERESRAVTEVKKLVKAGTKTKAAEKLAKQKFWKLLGFDLFYKPEDFEKILRAMDEIKGFQYEVGTKVPQDDGLIPQNIELKKIVRKVIFANKSLVDKITNSISAFVKANKITKGKVIVVDPTGETVPIAIAHNIEGFGEFDFDEVTAEIALDLENFSGSWVTKKLLAAAKSKANRALFYV